MKRNRYVLVTFVLAAAVILVFVVLFFSSQRDGGGRREQMIVNASDAKLAAAQPAATATLGAQPATAGTAGATAAGTAGARPAAGPWLDQSILKNTYRAYPGDNTIDEDSWPLVKITNSSCSDVNRWDSCSFDLQGIDDQEIVYSGIKSSDFKLAKLG